ncbi:MAG: hypothetical protein FJX64_09700 [Alphaproteobacteria bacterium]|nr:hypothetical protein [Alphaproteobacteria bacterium]
MVRAWIAAALLVAWAPVAIAQGARPAASPPRAASDRSLVILPMTANEEDIMAVDAAKAVWPFVAHQVALDSTIKVIEPPEMPAEFHAEASAVDAGEKFGARYVFMAKVSGDHIYRFDSALRDARTGAIVWGHVFFTDDYNIHSLPGEMGVALRLVFEKLP